MYTRGINGSWGVGGGGTEPSAPSITAHVDGDTQSVMTVDAAAATDVIYLRWRLWRDEEPWAARSESFKRTGDGNITLTGLTNGVAYEICAEAKADDLYSVFSTPVHVLPLSASGSEYEKLMDAVAAEINALALTDLDGTTVTATVENPPIFRDVDTAVVKVFADGDTVAPVMSNANTINSRVNLALCHRATAEAGQERQLYLRQVILDALVGNRLSTFSDMACVSESSPTAFNVEELRDAYNFVSPITVEYMNRRGRS